MPTSAIRRKGIFGDIIDINHFKICENREFHSPCVESFGEKCICMNCGEQLEHYHVRFDCNPFKQYPKYEVTQHKEFQGNTEKNETTITDNQPIQVKCAWCKYDSFKIGRVKKHIKTVHLKIKDFNCNTCEYKTSQEGRLKTHMEKVHQKS